MLPVIIASIAASTAARTAATTAASTVITGNAAMAARRAAQTRRNLDVGVMPSSSEELDNYIEYREESKKRSAKIWSKEEIVIREFDSSSWTGR